MITGVLGDVQVPSGPDYLHSTRLEMWRLPTLANPLLNKDGFNLPQMQQVGRQERFVLARDIGYYAEF